VIRSDEEDEEEEIVVYGTHNGRQSFSLYKKSSFEDPHAHAEHKVESADFAVMLHKERKRNSKKLEKALDQRPTPTDMIEFGYISAQNVNEYIPIKDEDDGLNRQRAELNRLCHINDWYVIQNEKLRIKQKRRRKLLSFYDRYLFNSIVDDDANGAVVDMNMDMDVDDDYNSMCSLIQSEHTEQLQQQHGDDEDAEHRLFSRHDVIDELYTVAEQDCHVEKEWMRHLRARKFKIYVYRQKREQLQTKNEQVRRRLSELIEQIEIVQNTHKLEEMSRQIETLQEQKYLLLQNTCQQIDHLRTVIRRLYDTNIDVNHVVH